MILASIWWWQYYMNHWKWFGSIGLVHAQFLRSRPTLDCNCHLLTSSRRSEIVWTQCLLCTLIQRSGEQHYCSFLQRHTWSAADVSRKIIYPHFHDRKHPWILYCMNVCACVCYLSVSVWCGVPTAIFWCSEIDPNLSRDVADNDSSFLCRSLMSFVCIYLFILDTPYFSNCS